MRQKITIIKVGGAVLEAENSLARFLNEFKSVAGKKVLVHGGGRDATRMCTRLGIETKMVEGRRITDSSTLEVVTMVYGGAVNKRVVAHLQNMGVDAIGLTGADAEIIRSVRRKPVNGIDYGYVGDIENVNAEKLSGLLNMGLIPVIAPLTLGGDGILLNTNADTIASEIAVALSDHADVELLYCFEKQGVLANPEDDSSVITLIEKDKYKKLINDGVITGGMIPKVENAVKALDRGVNMVRITDSSNFSDYERGTTIK